MERSHVSLWALGFMTAVAVGAFLSMLFLADPESAHFSTFLVFYLVFFVAVTGIVAWSFLLTRGRFARIRRPLAFFFGDAVRQGMIIASLLTVSLYIEKRNQLRLSVVFALVVAAFFIETIAIRRKKRI